MKGIVTINHKHKKVNISFKKGILTFPMVKKALLNVKRYLDKNYQILVEGYFAGKGYSREVKAFLFALEILGQKEKIIFVDKAGYRKSERKKIRAKVEKLYEKGKKVRELSKRFKIPEKTIYRWIKKSKS